MDSIVILRKLRTLRSLGWGGTCLIAEATVLTIVVPVGFGLFGVARTQAGLRRWASLRCGNRQSEDLQTLILAVRRAQRVGQRTSGITVSCLTRSFVLWALLRSRGVDTDLRVGFRKRGEILEGHAWVEHNGVPLNEHPTVIQTYIVSGKSKSFDFSFDFSMGEKKTG